MGKKVPCTVIVNSPKTGHVFKEKECESMAEAMRYARDMGMPYRIYAGGRLVKQGWIPNR